jgi:membrane associated rhomboid family serine protease
MFPIRDHNPSTRTPFVTYALIIANVLIFLAYWLPAHSERELQFFFQTWGMIPARVMAGLDLQTIVTSMFLHAGWMHLAGNMLFLWIYGDNMEDSFGPIGFLLFYLACGAGAAGLQIAADPRSFAPMVGASGAIAGVMGGYLLLFPKAKIDIFIFFIVFFKIFPIPAWIVLGLWLGTQVFGGFATPSEAGGVAYFAHLGGFAAGVVLTLPLWLGRGGTAFWNRTHGVPPHPEAGYEISRSRIPTVRRMK